eukprot:TRINITY_DN27315_c0_g1_i1.p1 TRINITY_DN27315_c0_g1~~TRINITY_DN27315_c0_g1_i1.p1  ORF type:complete len:406 (-),score=68.29 TRINITY_DN27315_c0_g1_i1:61-1242(-)
MVCFPDASKTVLVVNNNENNSPGRYTPELIARLEEAGLAVREARSLEGVLELLAGNRHNDVGLIVTCGGPVYLTRLVDMESHITKTTAAMLQLPNVPVVGICYGMQLLAQLFGAKLVDSAEQGGVPGHKPGHWEQLRRTDAPSRLLSNFGGAGFPQWATNIIFVQELPKQFVCTAVDSEGRCMAMEHTQEQVYGFQWHPEVLNETVQRSVIDRIVGLVGQSRRMAQSRTSPPATPRHSVITKAALEATISTMATSDHGFVEVGARRIRLGRRPRSTSCSRRVVSDRKTPARACSPVACCSTASTQSTADFDVAGGRCSLHVADMQLRRVVAEAQAVAGSSRGVVGIALAHAKREALSALRRSSEHHRGERFVDEVELGRAIGALMAVADRARP